MVTVGLSSIRGRQPSSWRAEPALSRKSRTPPTQLMLKMTILYVSHQVTYVSLLVANRYCLYLALLRTISCFVAAGLCFSLSDRREAVSLVGLPVSPDRYSSVVLLLCLRWREALKPPPTRYTPRLEASCICKGATTPSSP